jgi:hypothetical protein
LPLTGAVFDGVVTAFDERREFIRRRDDGTHHGKNATARTTL